MKTVKTLALVLSIGTVFGACASSEKEVMTPASSVAPRTTPAAAAEQIAAARCDREARCNDVGPSKEFQNREHCLQVMRKDASDKLADDDCPNGIANRDLQGCLSDIGSENCGGVSLPFAKLDSMMACRQSHLCLE